MSTLKALSPSTSNSMRNPPLNQSDAITSLLSLGLTEASTTAPIPIRSTSSNDSITSLDVPRTTEGTASSLSTTVGSPGSFSAASVLSGAPPSSADSRAISVGPPGSVGGKHHRRLGSTGKARRRLSDAKEASARPILVSATSGSGLLSLSALTLSASPGTKPLAPRPPSTSGPSGISIAARSASSPIAIPVSAYSNNEPLGDESTSFNDVESEVGSVKSGVAPIPISGNSKQHKKRGIEYKCESCAKIYRHPNCLNKHRWEHTRQWREASKFVLSKHQQVQLLEAATILSFMGDGATSLPEDRSEWPSFLSGGSLPKAELVGAKEHKPSSSMSSTGGHIHAPISSSVPARMVTSMSLGGGPRLHDYTVPTSSSGVGAAQLRPGLVGVPHAHHHHTRSVSASSAVGLQPPLPPDIGRTVVNEASGLSMTIPSSSIRSESSGSGSGSGSSGAEEEDADIEIDVEVMDTEGEVTGEKGLRQMDDSASVIQMKTTKSYPVSVNAPPLGYSSYGRSASYGSYGAAATTTSYGSYGANGGYTPGSYQTSAPGYTHPYGSYGSYGSGSFGNRRLHGPGGLMKREDDEMSVGFSVKEEDEELEEEEEDTTQRRKLSERRWDGMEMEVDMDMD